LNEHHLIIRVGAGLIQFVYGSHSRMAADLTLDKNLFLLPFLWVFFLYVYIWVYRYINIHIYIHIHIYVVTSKKLTRNTSVGMSALNILLVVNCALLFWGM